MIREFVILTITKRRHCMKRKETLTGICFVLPGLIGFIIFILIPVIMSLGISFTEWNFLKGWDSIKFTGLRNYLKLFKDDWFVVSLRNNILFTAVTVPCLLILGLVMADLINRHTYGGSAIRVMIFIPYIASVVAVCTVWQVMLQPSYGPINEFLRTIGIENPPKWLVDEHWALIAIMLINIWSQVGYYVAVYMSGLKNVPADLYEAAEIDGASQFTIFWKIVLPLGKPILVTMGTFAGLAYWNDWTNGLYYIVKNTDLYNVQNLLNQMVQNIQFLTQSSDSNVTAAASTIPATGIQMAIAFVAILPIMLIFPSFQKYYAKGIALGAVKG